MTDKQIDVLKSISEGGALFRQGHTSVWHLICPHMSFAERIHYKVVDHLLYDGMIAWAESVPQYGERHDITDEGRTALAVPRTAKEANR